MSIRRTKIVATLGPASSSRQVIRAFIKAGMDVARLNFSHGSYDDHAKVIRNLREVSQEMSTPVTILQDLQGPKVRVGNLPGNEFILKKGANILLVPIKDYNGEAGKIPIDYPYMAEEAKKGMQVLLADGLFELEVTGIKKNEVACRVIEGGMLTSRKGVNFPQLDLKLPAVTKKDEKDLAFGLSQDVDWVSLSFVRKAADIRHLKKLIEKAGYNKPIIAKIEKPQAIEHLDEILDEVTGIMVARGDLGVELSPEKVPMLQKHIIESCNRRGLPVITATQMLESMIHEPRPTRAEASDVANAIIDGTDCVMLSGESAVGEFPVKAIQMMDRIAREVESKIIFKSYPLPGNLDIMALSESINIIEKISKPKAIVVLTASGLSALAVASQRPKTPIYAITPNPPVYHGLNLIWGIKPILVNEAPVSFDDLIAMATTQIKKRKLVAKNDKIVILAGIPAGRPRGTNFIKIQTI